MVLVDGGGGSFSAVGIDSGPEFEQKNKTGKEQRWPTSWYLVTDKLYHFNLILIRKLPNKSE